MIYSQPAYLTRSINWELLMTTVKPRNSTCRGGLIYDYTNDNICGDYFPFKLGKYEVDSPRIHIRRKYFKDIKPGETVPAILFISIGTKKDFGYVDFEHRDYESKNSLHFPCYCSGVDMIQYASYNNEFKTTTRRWLSVTKNINILSKKYKEKIKNGGSTSWNLIPSPKGIERKGLPLRRNANTPLYTIPLDQEMLNFQNVKPNKLNFAMISIVYLDNLQQYISMYGAHADIMMNNKTRRFNDGDYGNDNAHSS